MFLVSDGGLNVPVTVVNELCARASYVSATSTAGSRAPRLEEIIESRWLFAMEAINLMYRWYRNARTCYMYLHDVGGSSFLPSKTMKSIPSGMAGQSGFRVGGHYRR